ncbi:ABC transporter substrate-binding protein [Mangrovibrevibacter kandeliae]|uniref:ABC transporter substrate-binding protein n=1 Tax=Mangrovibrevibacter kandeliae TaxID=2968473 RepID=UPI0021195F2A|nr:ABC transporter substrate-binding protein [Aurantimonas sp. CSK15Z-1]MCQ8781332.1 ABC transporter substrate-binding protein [Aurantimonas sp. CSK15Z-1]
MRYPLIVATLAALSATSAFAADFRIGLQDDIDLLDPARSRTFVGEVVFESLCDSLVAVGADLKATPELARDWSWNDDHTVLTMSLIPGMVFHDGNPITAEAVKANLDRARTLQDSMRKTELQSVDHIDVVDDLTFKISLKQPDPTLLPQLSNRAGMIASPAAFAEGKDFSQAPVCSGPYKFVSRQQNYQIVLEKFDQYRNAGDYHFDRVVFLPIPDTTVRLANLRSGDLDMLERLAPADIPAVRDDPNLQLALVTSVGYQGLTINVGNGVRADGPLKDKRVRQALQYAIDRDVINEVVGAGTFQPAQQPFGPDSPYHDDAFPVTGRDVEKSKALLKEAGYDRVPFELIFANSTTGQQIAELIQAMVAEAGFDVTLKATEFASMLQATKIGDYDVVQVGWSGRYDPDGNLHQFVTCGAGLNYAGYCSQAVDDLLNKAKVTPDVEARKDLYDQAQAILQDELPLIYVYHQPWPFVLAKDVHGFTPLPTGLISLKGVTKG